MCEVKDGAYGKENLDERERFWRFQLSKLISLIFDSWVGRLHADTE